MKNNDYQKASQIWTEFPDIIPYLFTKPNPVLVKYCLTKQELIKNNEVR